jgi:hypothetical protein
MCTNKLGKARWRSTGLKKARIIKIHNAQGGFCLLMGVPGTDKSVIKEFLKQHASKETLVVPTELKHFD